ncbi:MAG: hypothetical protein HC806_05540 [Anaerolineae bacterium]|nr:hypothetical protein [Anaerolineae bacterium]
MLHTMWGGRVNRPLGLALRAAWHSRFAEYPELSIRNDALVFQYKADADVITLLGMIDADNIERLAAPELGRFVVFRCAVQRVRRSRIAARTASLQSPATAMDDAFASEEDHDRRRRPS